MVDKIKIRVAIGLLLVVIGLSFLSSDFIAFKREEVFSSVNIELNEVLAANDTEPVVHEENEEVHEEVVVDEVVEEKQYEPFAGVLEIPKIGFSKGFYQKGSSLNNVKFNLKIIDASSYPDEDKGNVIIIGHSGNYSNSYFARLYQLDVNDTASIQYNGNYHYKIVNIYTEAKDGSVTIYRDVTKSCLTLITCTKDDNTKQSVYIFEQYSVE